MRSREPGLHALLRTHRALARAGRVPVRGQPAPRSRSAAAPTSRTTAGSPSSERGSTSSIAGPVRRAGPFETEARFGFHHVNSYEDGGEVVADICTFQDAGVVEDLYMDRLRAGKPVAPGFLERFRISPEAGTVETERLIDESIELPRINYGRCNERPYRYAWGVGMGSGWIDRIVKADVVERTSTEWFEDDAFPGEPVFVASPGWRGARTKGSSFRWSSTAVGATRSCSSWTRARSGSWPEPRFRTTSRTGSTANSLAAEMSAVDALAGRHPLRVAFEGRDIPGVARALAPDVVLHSPVTLSIRFVGREEVTGAARHCPRAARGSRIPGGVRRGPGARARLFRPGQRPAARGDRHPAPRRSGAGQGLQGLHPAAARSRRPDGSPCPTPGKRDRAREDDGRARPGLPWRR